MTKTSIAHMDLKQVFSLRIFGHFRSEKQFISIVQNGDKLGMTPKIVINGT